MTKKKHTLWPIGILLIIALGIVLIIVSIRISSKQSIDTDHTFGMKKIELDENINLIMQQQNTFEKLYNVHVSTIADGSIHAPIMKNPYYVTPVPKNIPTNEGLLQGNDIVTLYFEKKINQNMRDELSHDFKILSVTLAFVRLEQGEKEVSTLTIPMTKHTDNSYITAPFSLPMHGYYQARFTINIATNDATKPSQFPVYFYHWLFNE